MGSDIHVMCEIKRNGQWEYEPMLDSVFDGRQYSLFGFLANVRNYSESPFIQQSRGIPKDASEEVSKTEYGLGEHNFGYVTFKELSG